jgi:hypothetical protein
MVKLVGNVQVALPVQQYAERAEKNGISGGAAVSNAGLFSVTRGVFAVPIASHGRDGILGRRLGQAQHRQGQGRGTEEFPFHPCGGLYRRRPTGQLSPV